MFKQTQCAAGGNLTEAHVKAVSMSALFLLDAAKTTDESLGVSPQTTSHTVRDAKRDINKMRSHILEYNVTKSVMNRTTPIFVDPTSEGFKTTNWLKETMSRTPPTTEVQVNEDGETEIDLNYELCDTN